MAGEPPAEPPAREIGRVRFAVPKNYVLDDMEPAIADAFDRTLRALSRAGASIAEIAFAELDEIPRIMARGALVTVEAYATHREHLARWERAYDPRVAARIKVGAAVTAADYIELARARTALIARAARATAEFDAVLCPTVVMAPPLMAPLERDDELYLKTNLRVLRNTTAFNVLDRCALSLPIHEPGAAPAGLMLVGEPMSDRTLLGVAAAVEVALAR
jgi:aspartyl-tRNA(Asn)/glutamyl-tRNA(Gln) amidotransferase subunit A